MPERRRLILTGAIAGLALTAPLTALLYLGAQVASFPMVAFDLFEGLTRISIFRGLIAKSIDIMVGIFSRLPGVSTDQISKAFEQASAVGLFLVLGIVAGIIYALMSSQLDRRGGITLGVIGGVIALAIEIIFKPGNMSSLITIVIWFAIVFIAWGYALGWTINQLLTPAAPEITTDVARRNFLVRLSGGTIVLTLASWGIGRILDRPTSSGTSSSVALGSTPTPSSGTEAATSAATQQASNFVVAPGTRAEITPNDRFYRVDVNLAVPDVSADLWTLEVGGQVNKSLSLSYKDVTGMPAIKQYATLECISNEVGGNLISNTLWTGVKLSDVLNQAGLKAGVVEIKFVCEDGYTESLPLESAMDERTMLMYHMNGQPLPAEHGYPLRLYTPNRYGMKNPKWVNKIEAVTQPIEGYWELGGWDKDAIVKSTSIIDQIATDKVENGAVPIGGIAFAGARGISKVELAVDGGAWQPAELKPPLSPLTWVLWRFNWTATKGHHDIRVRATDGQGQVQIEAVAPLAPNGASGYVSQSADVN